MAVYFDPVLGELRYSDTDAAAGIAASVAAAHGNRTDNPHAVTAAQIGLGNADNTRDADKPVSAAQQAELDKKVDKEDGKGLSECDFTAGEKEKLAGIGAGAEANAVGCVKANGTTLTPDSDKCVNIPAATTGAYGVTKLSSSTSSTSQDTAATSYAVRQAYNRASDAWNEASNARSEVSDKVSRSCDDTVTGRIDFRGPKPVRSVDGYFSYELTDSERSSCFWANIWMRVSDSDPVTGEWTERDFYEIFSEEARKWYTGGDRWPAIYLDIGGIYGSQFTMERQDWDEETQQTVTVESKTVWLDECPLCLNYAQYNNYPDSGQMWFDAYTTCHDEEGNYYSIQFYLIATVDGNRLTVAVPGYGQIYDSHYDEATGNWVSLYWMTASDFPFYGVDGSGLGGSNDPASQFYQEYSSWTPTVREEFCTRTDNDILAVVNALHNADSAAHANLNLGANALKWRTTTGSVSGSARLTVADHTVFSLGCRPYKAPSINDLTLNFPEYTPGRTIEFYILVYAQAYTDLVTLGEPEERSFKINLPSLTNTKFLYSGSNPFEKFTFNNGETYRLYHFTEMPVDTRSSGFFRSFYVTLTGLAKAT